MDQLRFRFKEKTSVTDFTSTTRSARMLKPVPREWLLSRECMRDFDPALNHGSPRLACGPTISAWSSRIARGTCDRDRRTLWHSVTVSNPSQPSLMSELAKSVTSSADDGPPSYTSCPTILFFPPILMSRRAVQHPFSATAEPEIVRHDEKAPRLVDGQRASGVQKHTSSRCLRSPPLLGPAEYTTTGLSFPKAHRREAARKRI